MKWEWRMNEEGLDGQSETSFEDDMYESNCVVEVWSNDYWEFEEYFELIGQSIGNWSYWVHVNLLDSVWIHHLKTLSFVLISANCLWNQRKTKAFRTTRT